MGRLPKPPGPIGLPLLGMLPQYRREPAGFLLELAREYGDVVSFRIGMQQMHLINRPDLIEEILVQGARNFRKSRILQRARVLLGNGLLTAEGEDHVRQRKLIQPWFYRDRLPGYAATMVECGQRAMQRWRPGETLDVSQEMMRLTLAIVGRTLFSRDLETDADEMGKALTDVIGTFETLILPFGNLLQHLPLTPGLRRAKRARRLLNDTIYRLIAERRASPDACNDLLAALLNESDSGKGRLTDQEVRDQALTLVLAGHETTANALTWTWYLLSQNPEAEQRLQDELREVLGDRPPSWDDLPRLAYTERVLAESMRLYPPAWAIGRMVVNDFRLFHFLLRRKSICLLSPYVMHRDPRYWRDPERFDPDRFLPEEKELRPRFAYFPFGGGPRACIGERFAWMEGVLLLALIGRQWQFRLAPGHRVAVHPQVTLRPRHGMRMHPQRVIA